jgi:hypothetical protein
MFTSLPMFPPLTTAHETRIRPNLVTATQAAKGWKKRPKTYNSGYSLVVTHLTTNPPVRCLNRAERTGSLVFNVLWSYVEDMAVGGAYKAQKIWGQCHTLHPSPLAIVSKCNPDNQALAGNLDRGLSPFHFDKQ